MEKNLRKMREDRDDLQRYVDDLTIFLPLAFCTVNPLHLILGVNQAFQDLSNYGEMEVIGNEMDTLFLNKEEIEEFKKEISLKKERVTREASLLVKDKEAIPVSISALARRDTDGNFLGYFLTVSDISDIKEFQKRLEQRVNEKTKELADSRLALINILEETDELWKEAEVEKDKTMTVISNFIDGLLLFNKENAIEIINAKAEHFLKIESDEINGLKIEDLVKIEHLSPLLDILFKSKELGKGGEDENDRNEVEINKGQTLEISIVPVITGEEKIGTLVSLHDISREKMIEAMKSEFVSIAAHQLRTPLSAIKWTTRMLLDGDLGELNEEQTELVEKTYASNERMVNLINDLLNVSRIEEGRYLYKPELVHIEEITDPIIDSYKAEIERRGLKIEVKKPNKETPTVVADQEKITLVIQNLLDNAMKYSLKGGDIIFTITHNDKDNRVQVSIKDSGVGIPKDQQERLFGKFFRATNVIRMETEGSGLGLFISKNIIEAHEGRIWFDSEEGKGSTFYFDLPVKDQKGFEEFVKKL